LLNTLTKTVLIQYVYDILEESADEGLNSAVTSWSWPFLQHQNSIKYRINSLCRPFNYRWIC